MEINHQEDSKSSSEENERSEQNDQMGAGRSYECEYCKRGFTTAQALGGHMNIHRKDRAMKRPSSVPSVSSRPDESYANLKPYLPIQSYSQHHSTHSEVLHVNYQGSFPSSTDLRPPHKQHSDEFSVQYPWRPNRFEEDEKRTQSMQVGPAHAHEDGEKRDSGRKEDQVDLELRLGHYP